MRLKKSSKITLFWVSLALVFLFSGGQVLTKTVIQAADHSDVIITEFVAANASGLTDENGDHSDWIEIYNRSYHPVNLAGWSLTDDPHDPNKWSFPDVTLGSHKYLVIFASGKNRNSLEPGTALHTNFKLNRETTFLALHNVFYRRFMDSVVPHKPEQVQDVAFGRKNGDMEFGYLIYPTPGIINNDVFVPQEIGLSMEHTIKNSDPDEADGDALAHALITSTEEQQQLPLAITEIMYHPTGGDDYEFIEVKNTGAQAIDVGGVSFEGIGYTFPGNLPPMAPDQVAVLVRNAGAFAQRYPDVTIAGIYDGQLSNQGESIIMKDARGLIITTVSYDDEYGWPLSSDGLGDSLVLITRDGVPNNPKNWRASAQINGSPGVDQLVAIASTGP